MIAILSLDNSLKTFINVQLILARYQARFSIFTSYVSSSVLSCCSIKHDDDDDDEGSQKFGSAGLHSVVMGLG